MQTVPANRPSFPHATLSRMTGYSEKQFGEQLEELSQIDYAEFEGDARVSADNVYLLAATSTLVYESEQAQATFLAEQEGVESFHFLDSEDNAQLGHQAPDTGTQVATVETDDALIVSARGTVFATEGPGYLDREWEDVLNNINVLPTANYADTAFVHSGFRNAADGIWEQLAPIMLEASDKGKAIHFTGHSLGGAIATHLYDKSTQSLGQRPASLTTFGGPAVGWNGQRAYLESSGQASTTLRFADSGDPTIYSVPGGRHAGQEAYFDRQGDLHAGYGWQLGDRMATTWDDLRQGRNPVSHHHPLNYCARVDENRERLDTWN